MATAGKYSCEVSADAPSFHTLIAAAELEVVGECENKNSFVNFLEFMLIALCAFSLYCHYSSLLINVCVRVYVFYIHFRTATQSTTYHWHTTTLPHW